MPPSGCVNSVQGGLVHVSNGRGPRHQVHARTDAAVFILQRARFQPRRRARHAPGRGCGPRQVARIGRPDCCASTISGPTRLGGPGRVHDPCAATVACTWSQHHPPNTLHSSVPAGQIQALGSPTALLAPNLLFNQLDGCFKTGSFGKETLSPWSRLVHPLGLRGADVIRRHRRSPSPAPAKRTE